MMVVRYLLDTTIIIALMRGDKTIEQHLHQADEVFTPSIALGELFFGAQNSTQQQHNLTQTRQYATRYVILPCDASVAEEYGLIRYDLRARGTLIPENDMWIAATARYHHLILATRDNHFKSVSGLQVEIW